MVDLKYKGYTAAQFAGDEAFWQWVLEENEALAADWEAFLRAYPNQAAGVEQAKRFVLELNHAKHTLPENKSQTFFEKIQRSIAGEDLAPD